MGRHTTPVERATPAHGESHSRPGSSMATLCELTRWKDPVLSGLVAGSGLLFLAAISCYSLIAVAAYFGLSLVLLGLGSKLYVHLMGLLKKPCEDYLESAKFALVAYLATFIGAIMNSLTLVIIAWVAAFSLPTVYAAKQKEVDAMLATATTHYTALNAKLVALVPQQQTQAAKEE